MDENLKDYLDVRFCGITKQLQIMQSSIDEMGTKLDHHGDRITSAEKDVSYLADYTREDKIDTKHRREACEKIMDQKDQAVKDNIKLWVYGGIGAAIMSVLSLVLGKIL